MNLAQTKHIFFDLDRTLWDFEANSHTVLNQLMDEYAIEKKCQTSRRSFIKTYWLVNDALWKQYREGQITKEQLRSSRFYHTMLYFGHDDPAFGLQLEHEYISRAPSQKQLIADAIEVLEYLKEKYTLHIITNGFKEIQHIKLNNTGLSVYFDEIIISEEIGFNKPHRQIFQQALEKAGTTAGESIMVGDDIDADIIGAINAGIAAVYFNPLKKPHNESPGYEITSLMQLKDFL